MDKRLLEFIQSNDMNLGSFADSIGVQPSAISHIVSGRNKPSFDFIARTLARYPDLNPKWFILGQGSMLFKKDKAIREEQDVKIGKITDLSLFDEVKDSKISTLSPAAGLVDRKHKAIDRIVIFYLDGSFEEYINR